MTRLSDLTADGLRAAAQGLLDGLPGTVIPEEAATLMREGMSDRHAAQFLQMAAAERAARDAALDRVSVVWTGPDVGGGACLKTRPLVESMFRGAERSVLVASFVVCQGPGLLEPLHDRMLTHRGLDVRLFLNVGRKYGDCTATDILIADFARHFRERIWPWPNRPHVFFDPRAFEPGAAGQACLHAKCIVVDDRRAFVTSANLTEAAQDRNIELGIVLDDPHRAKQITQAFGSLVDHRRLIPLPGV